MADRAAASRGMNGESPALRAVAMASAVAYDDPMSKVLGLDAKTSTLGAWFGFTSGGTALMGAVLAFASVVAWMHAVAPEPPTKPAEVEILPDDTPPPPPPPPTATAEPEPEAKPAAPPPRAAQEPPPPPPAPAQAAKVLTAEPKPEEPLDLTGNTIVQGTADSYAGGFTTATGTGKGAVNAMPSPTGAPGATGPVQAPPAPSGPDRSRTASLGGGGEWSCPFPAEADTNQIDDAYVTLQVDVKADGSPGTVRVLSDPGNGFGREARRCAMNKHYATALDHDGNAIPGTTKAFRVHFQR